MTSTTVLSSIITSCQNATPTVLVLLIRSTLLLALGLLAAHLLQKRGPVWTSAILRATLVCAILGGILPFTPIGLNRSLWTLPPPVTDLPAAAIQKDSFRAGGFSSSATVSSPSLPTNTTSSPPPDSLRTASLTAVEPQFGWPVLLMATWFSISSFLILRLFRAQVVLARLSHQSSPATCETADILEELCSRMNVPRPDLRQSAGVHCPFLAGLRRPCIYLPANMIWEESMLRAILLHEIAHHRRRDCLWSVVAYVASALLPIQPLLWLLRRKMEAVSEQACDLEVVNGGCPAPAYAATLLRLADAWLPARPQPLLAAGVVSFRTNLGRRIQVILSGPRAALLSRRSRVMVFAGTLVCTAAVMLLISTGSHREWRVPPGYLAHFKLGQREGWSIGPVINVPREDKPWPPSHLPPPMVTPEQQHFIKELDDKRFAPTTYASGGPPESYRHFIETILTKRPLDFYGEYRMAISYLESHDLSNYHRWLDMSLRDAPAVLAGRMQYNGGEPVVGYEFEQSIQLFQPGNRMEPRGRFMFYTILTDEDGCYYMPVYRANYENSGTGWDNSRNTVAGKLDQAYTIMDISKAPQRYTVAGRVGVLPPKVAQPDVRLHAPYDQSVGSIDKPIPIRGSFFHLAWDPYPGANSYRVAISEPALRYDAQVGMPIEGTAQEFSTLCPDPADPLFHEGASRLELNLPLSGMNPLLDKFNGYEITVEAMKDQDHISSSRLVLVRPVNALTPVTLTKASFQSAVGRSITIEAVTPSKQKVIVTGICPGGSNISELVPPRLFGASSLAPDFTYQVMDWSRLPTGRYHFKIWFLNKNQ